MEYSYVIVADSCEDLDAELVKEYGLNVIPMEYIVDGQVHLDDPLNRTQTVHEFYEELRAGKMSHTAQITPEKYTEFLTPFLEQGKDVLLTVFSSALSGTYLSAKKAVDALKEKFPERKIFAVDSLSASVGEGYFNILASRNREKGMGIEENAKWLEENRLTVSHLFTVDNLNFLKRGGRLSASKAFLGTLLLLKPVLHVTDEGKLVPTHTVRGRKQALRKIVDEYKETALNSDEVLISDADDREYARQLGKMIEEECGVKSVIYQTIGPVIGSHVGPNCLALYFLSKKR